MTHLWMRAEQRPNEERAGLTPEGARRLIERGFHVTVEDSPTRILGIESYRDAGCEIVPAFCWPEAPREAIILGLKELPDDNTPLVHRHIMFGHAYKGQPAGQRLLRRFIAGGGTLHDLEYLVDDQGRRVAAFGYWAGFAGAAVSLLAWAAQEKGDICPPVQAWPKKDALLCDLSACLDATGTPRPDALIIGALGRTGSGAGDLCAKMGVSVTRWDMAETAHGGPFPEVLEHALFFNCILARTGTPVFVADNAGSASRKLRVIGDIACDPESDFSPVRVYDRATTWAEPALRVHDAPPLDVMAIDNLPSLLPLESSRDFANQLLPWLLTLDAPDRGAWGRTKAEFIRHTQALKGTPA